MAPPPRPDRVERASRPRGNNCGFGEVQAGFRRRTYRVLRASTGLSKHMSRPDRGFSKILACLDGGGGSAQGPSGWLCWPVAAPIGLSPPLSFCYDKQASVLLRASALPRASTCLGGNPECNFCPWRPPPDGLISASYAVITKTPGREVLTTTSNMNVTQGHGC